MVTFLWARDKTGRKTCFPFRDQFWISVPVPFHPGTKCWFRVPVPHVPGHPKLASRPRSSVKNSKSQKIIFSANFFCNFYTANAFSLYLFWKSDTHWWSHELIRLIIKKQITSLEHFSDRFLENGESYDYRVIQMKFHRY